MENQITTTRLINEAQQPIIDLTREELITIALYEKNEQCNGKCDVCCTLTANLCRKQMDPRNDSNSSGDGE